MVAGEQDPLALLLAQPGLDKARLAFATIVALAITCQGLTTPCERVQADSNLAVSANQARTRGMGLADQLIVLRR